MVKGQHTKKYIIVKRAKISIHAHIIYYAHVRVSQAGNENRTEKSGM